MIVAIIIMLRQVHKIIKLERHTLILCRFKSLGLKYEYKPFKNTYRRNTLYYFRILIKLKLDANFSIIIK